MNALCTPLLPRLPLRSNMFALPARPSAQKDVNGEKSRQENLILFVSQEEKFLSWAPTRIGVSWRAELLKEIVNFRSRRWNGKRLSSGLINNTSQQKIYSTSFISIQCNYGEWQRRLKSTRAMDESLSLVYLLASFVFLMRKESQGNWVSHLDVSRNWSSHNQIPCENRGMLEAMDGDSDREEKDFLLGFHRVFIGDDWAGRKFFRFMNSIACQSWWRFCWTRLNFCRLWHWRVGTSQDKAACIGRLAFRLHLQPWRAIHTGLSKDWSLRCRGDSDECMKSIQQRRFEDFQCKDAGRGQWDSLI